ncbi:MAG TPA: galactokinase, partial [Firmicutes bacterium]|nr:galactokinase [Bacillota bacterium]
LKERDFPGFLSRVVASGRSSALCLQNLYSCSDPAHQGLTLALALSESILAGKGAWRVHGGGFAGTIQAFVPREMLETYRAQIEAVFGEGACHVLSVRSAGGVRVKLTKM